MTTNTITGAPKLLFLGAGASKPYGSMLMGEFVQSFRKKAASVLLDAICSKQEDLEFLIAELDALGSRDYLESQTFNPYPDGGAREQRWAGFSQLASEARSLLADLKREVYLHYRALSDPTRTSILAKPIELLKSDSYPTVVFTTNYDPAVERFCASQGLRLTDGFVHKEQTQEYVWDRVAFDRFAGSPENSLVLFKLHGSATWHLEHERILKGPPMYDINDPEYRNVMIYPATTKVAISEPFFTAYDYLERCLDAAESCLVIGYSFRDYDTLMRFKSAKLSNRRLRIAVLDPHADAVCKHLEAHGISGFPIPYAFGGYHESEYLPLITSGTEGRLGA